MHTASFFVGSFRFRAVAAGLAALTAAWPPAADAQQPTANASVEALVDALRGSGPTTRSFRRTPPPDVGSSLCAGQEAPATPASVAATATAAAAGPAASGAAGTRSLTGRNLEVVPYAGDTTPGVNLSVQFATGSDKLTAADRALLDNLAKALQTPDLKADRFAVAGHTDTTGDDRINLELSCARALAVRTYLGGKGVAVARLSAYGFGSQRLLDANQPIAGVNRRVEVRKAPE